MALVRSIFNEIFRRKVSISYYGKAYSAASTVISSQNDAHAITFGDGQTFSRDERTNVTPKILSHVGRNLHLEEHHPVALINRRLKKFLSTMYRNKYSSPMFTFLENLHPAVSVKQNFDSVLIPADHVSRRAQDTYYVNSDVLLRTHTSAHQADLVASGLDAFVVVGDCYRRDEIDPRHYPVFHQAEGVRLMTADQVFDGVEHIGDDSGSGSPLMHVFEAAGSGRRNAMKQETHTLEASKLVEADMKRTILAIVEHLMGTAGLRTRWVDAYFPFTHPSWELEILRGDEWVEVCGCGVMEAAILDANGASSRIGWAFGIGLDRLAMLIYDIPDIRLLWSQDSGFLSQFRTDNIDADIKYKAVSQFPQCYKDISFWVPQDFEANDFFDLVRTIGGDLVEQVRLKDMFVNEKTGKTSHCYAIVYRHMEKTLTTDEANEVHNQIAKTASEVLRVEIR